MPRKSAAQPKEPASLPETPIPLSEAPAHQRSAYEIELINNPEQFRSVVSGEDFFGLIAGFPEAWWGERLSMYLYRLPDEDGLMVKNAEGEGKYIKPVIRHCIDRDWVASRNGGGKYQILLNCTEPQTRRQITVRKYTFRVDGPPAVKEGQVIELNGKPVSVGASQTAPVVENTDVAKVIQASAAASEKNQEMVVNGAKAVIEMVKEQASSQNQPVRNPLEDIKTLLEIVRPQTPAADPVQQELMKAIIAKAFAEPKVVEVEEKETPVEKTLEAIQTLTGGKSLADLMKPAVRAEADSMAGWAPIVSTIGGVASQFLERWPAMMAARNEQLRLEIHLRTIQFAQQKGEPIPTLPALPPAPSPQAPSVQSATPPVNQPLDQARLMNALVMHICAGFDKAPVGEWGEATAAAMDFHFSGTIESIEGLTGTLANAEEVDKLVAGVVELEKRSHDARWKIFREDFLEYCQNRWGVPAKPGPQPVA